MSPLPKTPCPILALIPELGPGPNTDPGLAGETGVSPGGGSVYGVNGLKVGAGIDGTLSSGGGPESARFAPCARTAEIPPCACACSIAIHAPNKATHAATDNVVSAICSIFLLRIAVSV